MNRRLLYIYPGTVDTTYFAKNGQPAVYSGSLDSTLTSEFVYDDLASLSVSLRPSFEGPYFNSDFGVFAVEHSTENYIVTSGSKDAVTLIDWTQFGSPTTFDITSSHSDGPWGSDGPKATYINVAGGSSSTFYYGNAGFTSVSGTSYKGSIYIKPISGTVRVRLNGSTTYQDFSVAGLWDRANVSFTGNGSSSVQLLLETPTAGGSATFLVCCGQIELSTLATSFVNGSRSVGKIQLPNTLDTSNFTFSGWAAPAIANTSIPSKFLEIVEGTSYSAGKVLSFGRSASANEITLTLPTGDSTSAATTSATTWVDGDWHHVVLVVDTGVTQMYIDGVSFGVPFGTAKKMSNPTVWLGNEGGTGSSSVGSTLISDVSIFDTPLTSAEIANLYVTPCGATTVPLYIDLDNTTIPQPTVSMQGTSLQRSTVIETISGRRITQFLTNNEDESFNVQWGPLVQSEINIIKDFYDANGSWGTFYFTPPNGIRGVYRFSNKKPLNIVATPPQLYKVSGTIIKVS